MITERSLRAGRRAALVLALTTAAVVNRGVSAHRLDEYLQAARIAVDPSRVELELDLTPGIAVADEIIGEIDRDQDGSLGSSEKQVYAEGALRAIAVQIDGQTLQTELMASTFPVPDAFRGGDGTIRLRATAGLPRLSMGTHQLFFRNSYRPDVSVYLANALVPESDQIAITGQHRDGHQRDLTIDFVVRTEAATPPRLLLGGIASAALLMAFVTRRTRRAVSGHRPGGLTRL
jgi:hypothetical protein